MAQVSESGQPAKAAAELEVFFVPTEFLPASRHGKPDERIVGKLLL